MIQRSIAVALAALGLSLVVLPVSAGAATFTLVGTTARSCWEDTEGFTAPPDLQPNPLPAGSPPGTHFLRMTNHSTSSTVVLDTNGTVIVTDTITATIRNTTSGRVGGSQATCSGNWTFDAGTQRLTTTTTCNVTDLVGDSNTATIVATQAVYRLAGTILVRLETAPPPVETINVLTGPGAPFTYQRVCGASGTLHLVQ
jgi:hypothetical protein